MKLKKLTSTILAIAMTATSIPSVTAEEDLSFSEVITVAGAVNEVNVGDFEYEADEDGESVTITGYNGKGGDVVIPSEINGKRVSCIGAFALAYNNTIKTLFVSSGVFVSCDACRGCTALTTLILDGDGGMAGSAFQYCPNLKTIKLGKDVSYFYLAHFAMCSNLSEIICNEDNLNYCSIDGVLFSKDKTELIAYPIGKKDETYSIPDTVTYLEGDSFYATLNLKHLIIDDNLSGIGWRYQENGISFINLESFIVSEKNNSFFSHEGALYQKTEIYDDLTGEIIYKSYRLQCYPPKKPEINYSIPDGVTFIKQCAFSETEFLRHVSIPSSIESIEERTFFYCNSVVSVEVPESVTSIWPRAFLNCPNLTLYGYKGSAIESYAKENEIPFKIIGKEAAIDHNNGIIIENPNLDGKTLEVEKSNKSDTEVVYNIILKDKDGKKVQPEGNVMVKIPLPAGWKNASVSRREKDGTLTDMKAAYENDYMVFTTDHFSEYILSKKTEIQKADLNNDGKITTVDAKWVLQAVSGSRKLTPEQIKAADMNGDGKITTVDAKWILQVVSGSRKLS